MTHKESEHKVTFSQKDISLEMDKLDEDNDWRVSLIEVLNRIKGLSTSKR